MTMQRTVARAALAVALLALAATLAWVGMTRAGSDELFVALILVSALVALAAAALLFVRRSIGATLAMIAALLGAFWGLVLSICLFCGPQPLSGEAIVIFVAAGLTFMLALVELATLGLARVAIAIIVAVLALGSLGNPLFLGVLLAIAAVVAWLWYRQRDSPSGP
ncbi:MAG: hypothetical protein A2V84_05520 [Chloroflexi bacterium RBG_16_70_13]|nr:MAG: hypothetical protein A2V84_05520 [Chloroflexi bacterium RBG_16_70_13]